MVHKFVGLPSSSGMPSLSRPVEIPVVGAGGGCGLATEPLRLRRRAQPPHLRPAAAARTPDNIHTNSVQQTSSNIKGGKSVS